MSKKYTGFVLAVIIVLFINSNVTSHCDSRNGPVIKACEKALESGNPDYVLIWIREDDEKEIMTLFNKVVEVRKLNTTAREVADDYFFETVVRIHRMGEGVPYTGLKPVDYKPGQGIETADLAVENNSLKDILAQTDKKEHSRITELFNQVNSRKNFNTGDINSGREYVASYVQFIHYIEKLYTGETEEHHH